MPSGGLSMFGAGLQLQQVTPGIQDIGNANINGIMRAARMTTVQNDGGSDSEVFGHGITIPIPPVGPCAVFGNQATYGTVGSGCLIGVNCSCSGRSSVAVGLNASAGVNGDPNANKVAIGFNVSAGTGAGDGPSQVAVGSAVNALGGRNVAFGRTVTVSSVWAGTASENQGLGSDITATAVTRCTFLGHGITENAKDNMLVVGWYAAGGPVYASLGSNSIQIGNASQTTVAIGAYRIAQSTGGTVKVNDLDYIATSSDGIVMYTAITAARVETLPAANSVQAGFIHRVLDMSGNASAVNTITTGPAGADTIVGAGIPVINTPYGGKRYMSDGVSKWNQETNW